MSAPHIDEDLLDQYATGQLRAEMIEGVEEHLLLCQHCQDRIVWPARLDGTVALSLVVSGTTTQVRGECVAVRIRRYDFRTRKSRPNPHPIRADRNVAEKDASLRTPIHRTKGVDDEPPFFELETRAR